MRVDRVKGLTYEDSGGRELGVGAYRAVYVVRQPWHVVFTIIIKYSINPSLNRIIAQVSLKPGMHAEVLAIVWVYGSHLVE